MRSIALAAAVLLAAACSPASSSPSAPPSPSPDVPPANVLWLRATMTQALPPLNLFTWLPVVAITADGAVVVPGAVPAIYPGPQVAPLVARSISEAGRAAILQAARDLGLLTGATDFSGGGMPGQALGRVELVVDGRPLTLTGDPSRLVRCGDARCVPTPGTPEAFAAFWQQISSLASWLPGELGPEGPYAPPAYAILIGPSQLPDGGIAPGVADWPLSIMLGTAGVPVGDGTRRCLTVSGADAVTLRPALEAAREFTQWIQDPEVSASVGLTVRPMLDGEDVCRELFGVPG